MHIPLARSNRDREKLYQRIQGPGFLRRAAPQQTQTATGPPMDYRTPTGMHPFTVKPQYKTIPVVHKTTLEQDLRDFRVFLEKKSINRYTYRKIALRLKPIVQTVLRSVFYNELSSQGITQRENAALGELMHPPHGDRSLAAGLITGMFGPFLHWDHHWPELDQ